jgi:hypothetical protein
MKLLVAFVSATLLLADAGLRAEEALRGDLLEIHSCQLYIGGCIASAEATQDGRYLLRVWSFSGGSHNGVPLAGLQVALLETGDQNLADKDTSANASLAYLPQSAATTQNAALVDWLKRSNPELAHTRLQTRVVPMQFSRARNTVAFTAGDSLQVDVCPFEPCGLTSCGESLWYTPRSAVASYTVGVTSKSIVREPLLALTWIDHGKNNVFQGRFDEGTTAQAAFASPALVCAMTDHAAHD